MTDTAALERMIDERLRRAAETLRRMPMPRYGRPSTRLASYPDVVRNTIEAYGRDEVEVRDAPPHPSEIESMDEALGWLLWVDHEHRVILWARANGASWRKIDRRLNRCERTLKKMASAARGTIIANLLALTRKAG